MFNIFIDYPKDICKKKDMESGSLSVREIQESDIESIIQYWLGSDKNFLEGMGVDLAKIPAGSEWREMLLEQLRTPVREKKSYCLVWLAGGLPIGHSNINKIVFGEEAYMHLHLWNHHQRKKGLGTELVRLSLPWFFKNYQLKNLYSEPYAMNPAPNKTLARAGFELVKTYRTIPGWLNFEQEVNLWRFPYENLKT
jgi:RimJ/RimL family protein N-acetyltransferase